MLKDFKNFIMRGNVLDLAVAVIMGAAFGKIISSFVNDIIMPVIGLLLGGVSFSDLFISLDGKTYESLAQAREMGGAVLAYGLFLQNVIDFLIIALAIFLVLRVIQRMTPKPEKPAEPAAPVDKDCPHCFSKIPIQATRCPNCTSELNGV